jgi:hypothetical protein
MQILLHQIHQVVIKKFHRRYSLLEHTRICKWVQQEAMFSVASPSLICELFTIGIYSGHLLHPSKFTILKFVIFMVFKRWVQLFLFCKLFESKRKRTNQIGVGCQWVLFSFWYGHLCTFATLLSPWKAIHSNVIFCLLCFST